MAVGADEARMSKIERGEWLQVLGWSAVILLVSSLPYLYGALISSADAQFGGFIIGVEDGNSYLAKMRLGATGGWQFHLFYTSEPHQGAYLFLFHLLLGKIAALSGLSPVLVYHLARIGGGFFLLVSIYRFAAFFTEMRPLRQLAFWLVGVGSGLGWLVMLLGLLGRLGMPLDFYSPEAFIFLALFSLPHLLLAEGLLLWAILLIWLAWETQKLRHALLAGLSLLGMTLIAAFYIVIAAAVIGVGWLLRRWQMRQTAGRPWAEAGLALLSFAISAPVPVYNAYVFTSNPVFKVWAEQNRIPSPPPFHYLLAFGPLLLLAIAGTWTEWRPGWERDTWSQRRVLLVGWCVVVPLLVYIPFNLQRRLTLGVQVPLSILAALGLWRLLFRHRRDGEAGGSETRDAMRRWRIVSAALVALLAISNLLILVGAGMEVSRRAPPVFHTGAEVAAADWLAVHTIPGQVVLAAFETGNYLPTRMSGRVFAGHGPETVHSEAKREMLRRFFADTDDAYRQKLLADYNVSYVVHGPAERALGDFSPAHAPYLRQVYDNGTVQIYQVVNTGNDSR
ncbi:MAG: hypothetical protein Kow0063_22850 [Anaerolineae bacterium]